MILRNIFQIRGDSRPRFLRGRNSRFERRQGGRKTDLIPGLKPGAEMLHPFRVLVRGWVGLVIHGWNPWLRRWTPSGSKKNPNGVQHVSPERIPGIYTDHTKRERTPKGFNV